MGKLSKIELIRSTSRERARSFITNQVALNVFCPTGKGGGVDATCSLKGKKSLSELGTKLKAVNLPPFTTGGSLTVDAAKKIQKNLHELYTTSKDFKSAVDMMKEQTQTDDRANVIQAILKSGSRGKDPSKDKAVLKAVEKYNDISDDTIDSAVLKKLSSNVSGYLKTLDEAPKSDFTIYRGQKKTKSVIGDEIEFEVPSSMSQSKDVATHYAGGELLVIRPGVKYLSSDLLQGASEGLDGGVVEHRAKRVGFEKQQIYFNATMGSDEEVITKGKFKVLSIKEDRVSYEDQLTGKQKAKSVRIVELEPIDESPTDNVFCPTGKGGGRKATCSPPMKSPYAAGRKAVALSKLKPSLFKKALRAAWTVFNAAPYFARETAKAAGASPKVANLAFVAAEIGDWTIPGMPAGSALVMMTSSLKKPQAVYLAARSVIKNYRRKPTPGPIVIHKAEDNSHFTQLLLQAINTTNPEGFILCYAAALDSNLSQEESLTVAGEVFNQLEASLLQSDGMAINAAKKSKVPNPKGCNQYTGPNCTVKAGYYGGPTPGPDGKTRRFLSWELSEKASKLLKHKDWIWSSDVMAVLDGKRKASLAGTKETETDIVKTEMYEKLAKDPAVLNKFIKKHGFKAQAYAVDNGSLNVFVLSDKVQGEEREKILSAVKTYRGTAYSSETENQIIGEALGFPSESVKAFYEDRIKPFTINAVKKAPLNPLLVDPTRTTTLQRAFEEQLSKRFTKFQKALTQYILSGGMVTNAFCPTGSGGGVDPTCSPKGKGKKKKPKLSQTEWEKSLTPAERSAISYLTDFQPNYASINQAISNGGRTQDKETAAALPHLLNLIERAPNFEGKVFRGLTFTDSKQFERFKSNLESKQGIEFSGVTSSTKNPEQASRYSQSQYRGKATDRVVLEIEAKTGVDISNTEDTAKSQQEVVFRPGTSLRLLSIESTVIEPEGQFRPAVKEHRIRMVEGKLSKLANNAFKFETSEAKVQNFEQWIISKLTETMEDKDIYSGRDWWKTYVERAYKQGADRAFDSMKKKGKQDQRSSDRMAGAKNQFFSTFGSDAAKERMKLIAGRTYKGMKGLTDMMKTQLTLTLIDGMLQGQSPRVIAKALVEKVGVNKTRAMAIARTEIIRSHNEGTLATLKALGVQKVGVQVEVAVSGNACPICQKYKNRILTIEESEGLFPLHPNCKCTPIPHISDEPSPQKERQRKNIESSIRSATRKSPTRNVFCPTGPGGGIDATCSPKKSVASHSPLESVSRVGEFKALGHNRKDSGDNQEFRTKLISSLGLAHLPIDGVAVKLAQVAGAPKGAVVNVTWLQTGLTVSFKSDVIESAQRKFELGASGVELHNEWFETRTKNTGEGTKVLSQQVDQCHKAGISKIITFAAKSEDENGYYTWPRLGYDCPLQPPYAKTGIVAKLKSSFPEAQRISDIMKTPEGRAWWKENGASLTVTFDTDPNSLSRKVLESYVTAKFQKES